MKIRRFTTKLISIALLLTPVISTIPSSSALAMYEPATIAGQPDTAEGSETYIRWVDLNVPYSVLKYAYNLDVLSYGKLPRFNFCKMLAYLAAQNGNKFQSKRDCARLKALSEKLNNGANLSDLTAGLKYYDYYLECYTAIFAGFIGEYLNSEGKIEYGMKAYHPIAKNYGYNDYDDFGNSRSYGFRRIHLGHDIFAQTGTPVTATESGTVTECGWNQYGGWRIGIRSDDGKRYYYYAHLRKNHPYAPCISKGARVESGEVIGYVGATGYSRTENTNMSVNPHLHYGIQLIFHPSQVKGKNEIWIDVYSITRFLTLNRAEVKRTEGSKDYVSINLRRAPRGRLLSRRSDTSQPEE